MVPYPFLRLGTSRGLRVLLPLWLLVATAVAPAQGTSGTSARTERADPLDAQARVPAAGYQSALSSYRRLGEDRPVDWRQANQTVNRIGGWRAYARQAQQPEAAASATSAPVAPARGGHHRH